MNKTAIFKKGKGLFGTTNELVNQNDILVLDVSSSSSSSSSSTQLEDGIVSGNGVAWIVNYDYEVTPYVFNINNVQYSTQRRLITIDASDPTLNRIDVIAASYDSSGNGIIQVIKGQNAASPTKPTLSSTQLEITTINVDAATTEPSLTIVLIYDENEEYTGGDNTTGRVDYADTDKVFNGTKSVELTDFQDTDQLYFEGISFNPTQFNVLQFMISAEAKWQYNGEIEVGIYNNTLLVSNWVKVDGDPYNTKRNDVFFQSGNPTWQTIVIPIDKFNLTSSTATKIVFRKVDIGVDTFNIDLIRLQGGLTPTTVNSGHTIYIGNNNLLVYKYTDNLNNFALEIGDLVSGLWIETNTFWTLAIYNGGDVTNKDNYTVLNPIELT